MHNSKLDRFSFLTDKAVSQRATPQEMAEYQLLLDEWNQSNEKNATNHLHRIVNDQGD
jgi:uncharacterized protein YnzC (UPF0291/DUF896 family)